MAEQSLKEKTAKGLFWGGVSNGVQQVLNLLFGLVLARILDAEDYGMVGMLAIFSAIAGTIQESGFTAALANQKEIRHEDYNAVFWFSVLTGVVFYVLLFFCAPLIAAFYGKEELVGLSRILFIGFLLGGVGIAPNAYLFKTLMVKERAKIDVFSLICSGAVGVTLALNGFAYYGLAIQTTTYIGVGSLLKLCYSPWKPSFTFNWHPLKSMFGFSSKLILTNIFTQINNNLFSVVIGKFYTPTQLGFYSQGQKWVTMGHGFVGGMILNVAQPVLVKARENEVQKQVQIFRKMIRFGAFVSFPCMLGIGFISREFISVLLGDKWIASVLFVRLFCVWGAFAYLFQMYSALLMSYGQSSLYLSIIVLTGIAHILWLFISVPYGLMIMVVGYILINFFSLLFWHYYCSKKIPITFFSIGKDIIPYLLITIFSFSIAQVIVSLFSSLLLILILKIILSIIFYVCILYCLKSVILNEAGLFIIRKLKLK